LASGGKIETNKKSTNSSKAGLIRETLDLYHGHEDVCTPEIVRMLLFYETEEGFIIPASMIRGGEP